MFNTSHNVHLNFEPASLPVRFKNWSNEIENRGTIPIAKCKDRNHFQCYYDSENVENM